MKELKYENAKQSVLLKQQREELRKKINKGGLSQEEYNSIKNQIKDLTEQKKELDKDLTEQDLVNAKHMLENKEFDQIKYIADWKKQNKKQFKAELNIAEMEELNQLLNDKGLNKSEFVRLAINGLKNNAIGINYLVIKSTQTFEKRGNWINCGDAIFSTEMKNFDNYKDAKEYYDSISLEDNIHFNNRYSDYKELYKYDKNLFDSCDIEEQDFDFDKMTLISDEYSMTDDYQ